MLLKGDIHVTNEIMPKTKRNMGERCTLARKKRKEEGEEEGKRKKGGKGVSRGGMAAREKWRWRPVEKRRGGGEKWESKGVLFPSM